MTLEEFRTQFPEFQEAPDSLILGKMREAESRTDAFVWGAKREQGIAYLTAHLIALSPGGRAMQLVQKDGSTPYYETLTTLRRAVTMGLRVF